MREGPRRSRLLAVAALAGRLCFAQEGDAAAEGPVPPISEATGIAPPVVVEAERLPEPDGVRPEAVLGVEELRRSIGRIKPPCSLILDAGDDAHRPAAGRA